MSTYIRGVNDYIGQITPFKPNLQFHGTVNQELQSKYDANAAKLSNLYSSLLNADLTRDDNKASRDEFFNLIGTELEKISQLDLSQNQNVIQAQNVFQSIYQNKALVKDMVWTRNFKSEVERMEAIKNCINPAECGGQYWEEGEKYLLYKQQEFKNANSKDIFNMENAKFVAYNSVMDNALKLAKEADLNVTQDVINGGYKVTNKNGQLVKGALSDMFNKTIAQNPQFVEMFKVKAYVNRMDWVRNKVSVGEYSNENEALASYIQLKEQNIKSDLDESLLNIGIEREQIDERIKELESERNPTQQDREEYQNLQSAKQAVINNEAFLNQFKDLDKNKNNRLALNVYASILDNQESALMLSSEINKSAEILSYRGKEQKLDVDQIALERIKHANDVSLENIRHQNSIKLEQEKAKIKIELEEAGVSSSGSSSDKINPVEVSEYNQAIKNVEAAQNIYKSMNNDEVLNAEYQKVKDKAISEGKTVPEYNSWKNSTLKEAKTKVNALKVKANKKAYELGKSPYYLDLISPEEINKWDNKTTNDFLNSKPWLDNEEGGKLLNWFKEGKIKYYYESDAPETQNNYKVNSLYTILDYLETNKYTKNKLGLTDKGHLQVYQN